LSEELKSEIEVMGSMTEGAKSRKRKRLLQNMKLEKLHHVFKEEEENLKVKNSWILPESWSLLFRREIVLARQGEVWKATGELWKLCCPDWQIATQ